GGKGKDQVARRDPAFALEANKAREQQRVTVFYVAGAAPVEVASGFGELEGIEVRRPILLESLHHVEMAEEENWFGVPIPSAQTHTHIVLVGERPRDVHISRRVAARSPSHRHSLRGGSHVARRRVSGVDLDEFFENVARQLLRRGPRQARVWPAGAGGRERRVLRPGESCGEQANQAKEGFEGHE